MPDRLQALMSEAAALAQRAHGVNANLEAALRLIGRVHAIEPPESRRALLDEVHQIVLRYERAQEGV
jgi:hypothetical protein